jgi:hypothetical protein
MSGCPFIVNYPYSNEMPCMKGNEKLMKLLQNIKTVILNNYWLKYTASSQFNNTEGAVDTSFSLPYYCDRQINPDWTFLNDFERTILTLLSFGLKVVLIYSEPEVG